jgi:Ser/Thr protein kinase RdoA (MazF antagonist)
MVKAAVDFDSHTTEELQPLLADFGWSLGSHKKLYGGYSGTTYAVTDAKTGSKAVLKLCNGYDRDWIDGQTAIQSHLQRGGFEGGCPPIPLAADATDFVSMRLAPVPACLLGFVEGQAADAVIESGVSSEKVLHELGGQLAALNAVKATKEDGLRTYEAGGACEVVTHLIAPDGVCQYWKAVSTCEHTKEHPFLAFYQKRAALLREDMQVTGLPYGIMHGDPFLDNFLVAADGSFAGFVDFEDTCTGPLLFDIACCCIGTCFRAEDNKLDLQRLACLLNAYCSNRMLEGLEQKLFVRFMRLCLLCNCSWRFRNFNVVHREVAEARDSYKELQERIVALEDPTLAAAAQEVVDKACSLARRPTTSRVASALQEQVARLQAENAKLKEVLSS